MAEQDAKPTGQEDQNKAGDQQNQGGDQNKETKTFDESYVKSLRDEAAANRVKAKELEDKLNKITAEKEEADRKEAEKKGEFEKLYNEAQTTNTSLKQQVEDLTKFKTQVVEAEEAKRKTLVEKLPETMREAYKSASLQQLELLLETLNKSATNGGTNKGTQPPTNGGGKNPPEIPVGQGGWLDQHLANNPQT